jgi:maltose/moltooligosaccharide transporter
MKQAEISAGMSETVQLRPKPRLSFWQIWNMSFGFLGIQFGFALQNANVSRIFETLGGDTSKLAVYWLAAPLTGLLVQPIIGYLSDRTWIPKLGRRRPFFLIGAILASIALFFMPNSPSLWIAVGTLWIMDSSINISMEPFRAFVGDNLPSEQRTAGFAMQSFLHRAGGRSGFRSALHVHRMVRREQYRRGRHHTRFG